MAYDEGGYTGPSGLYWLWRRRYAWCGLRALWGDCATRWDSAVSEVFVFFVDVWDSGSLRSPRTLRTMGLSRA